MSGTIRLLLGPRAQEHLPAACPGTEDGTSDHPEKAHDGMPGAVPSRMPGYEDHHALNARYDLMPGASGDGYTVHDLVADIFGVDITDAQADRLLGLCPGLDMDDGERAVVAFADCICSHFVGRGLPWAREAVTEEAAFWSAMVAARDRFTEFIS